MYSSFIWSGPSILDTRLSRRNVESNLLDVDSLDSPGQTSVTGGETRGGGQVQAKGVIVVGISRVKLNDSVEIFWGCIRWSEGQGESWRESDLRCAGTVLLQASSWHSTAVPQP